MLDGAMHHSRSWAAGHTGGDSASRRRRPEQLLQDRIVHRDAIEPFVGPSYERDGEPPKKSARGGRGQQCGPSNPREASHRRAEGEGAVVTNRGMSRRFAFVFVSKG